MNTKTLMRELEEEKRKNLEEIMHHACWEAEMVRKLGSKWFAIRDKWLIEAYEADRKMWRDPRIREALIKTILAKNELNKRGMLHKELSHRSNAV
ncbi:MAG: hypothetical protein F7B59_05520 [Desulfurococcales archaeon]|nr:hypothetical protein [Desulfurococcales archaeon]